ESLILPPGSWWLNIDAAGAPHAAGRLVPDQDLVNPAHLQDAPGDAGRAVNRQPRPGLTCPLVRGEQGVDAGGAEEDGLGQVAADRAVAVDRIDQGGLQ